MWEEVGSSFSSCQLPMWLFPWKEARAWVQQVAEQEVEEQEEGEQEVVRLEQERSEEQEGLWEVGHQGGDLLNPWIKGRVFSGTYLINHIYPSIFTLVC